MTVRSAEKFTDGGVLACRALAITFRMRKSRWRDTGEMLASAGDPGVLVRRRGAPLRVRRNDQDCSGIVNPPYLSFRSEARASGGSFRTTEPRSRSSAVSEGAGTAPTPFREWSSIRSSGKCDDSAPLAASTSLKTSRAFKDEGADADASNVARVANV